jgi:hypothetical protein
MPGTGSKSPVLTIKKMKKSVLILALFVATVCTLNAQESTAPSKNKFGVTLSTNLFGLDDDLSNVAVGGGFYYSIQLNKRISLYSELDGSTRNFGNQSIMPGLSGEFTTGNVAFYFGPMYDIGKEMNIGFGIVENFLFNSELETKTSTKDISAETNNYSSLYFDFRHQFGNKFGLGTRYEWGLNSILKNVDRKVSTISFNLFLPLGGNRNQEKDK